MRAARRVNAVLSEVVQPATSTPGGRCVLALGFAPLRSRLDAERIDDLVVLGPELCVESAIGLGKLVRLLRAARIAPPRDPRELLGDAARAAALLERALGTEVVLALRPRARLRFTVWTEQGVECVSDVAEIHEDAAGFLLRRQGGRLPVLVPRHGVVRQRTDCETWYEVTSIERRG